MPEEGVSLSPATHLLTTEELLALTRMFVSLGVNKVRLTGGEPTVRKDLMGVISSLRAIPGLNQVCMTTNGVKLTNTYIQQLHAAGLSHVNISLDTLQRDKFSVIARRGVEYFDRVLAAVHYAAATPFARVKVCGT